MRMSIVGLIALGLVAAFSAALLMAAVGKPSSSRMSGSGDQEVTVFVAARDMPAVSLVRADDLIERTVKAKEVPAGAIKDSIKAIGQTLTRPVVEGQAITADCFAGSSRGMALVSNLPDGKRAVTVELKLSAGLEGLLYPGSVVDVLAFFKFDRDMKKNVADALSTTLLQGVKVLAIDDATAASTEDDVKNGNKNEGGSLTRHKTRRVTLLVDSRQAEALQLASVHGTVSLAMRNPHDTTESDRDATLLSGGQMASLAEYMGAWVGDQPISDDSETPKQSESRSPLFQNDSDNSHLWSVTVMRGDQVEVQSFELDIDKKSQVVERLN